MATLAPLRSAGANRSEGTPTSAALSSAGYPLDSAIYGLAVFGTVGFTWLAMIVSATSR